MADHLEIVRIEDGHGVPQTLQTTDEHPFHIIDKGWTAAKDLTSGAVLSGPSEMHSSVIATARRSHPEGVTVYNMEVEGSHTYFVRAEESAAEPVWVHNAENYNKLTKTPTNDSFAEHQAMRKSLGLPAAGQADSAGRKFVLGQLASEGEEIWGINGWGFEDDYSRARAALGTNIKSVTHAEGDAMYQAMERNWAGRDVVFRGDVDPCYQFCGRSDGIMQMARANGFRSIEIISPGGTTGRLPL